MGVQIDLWQMEPYTQNPASALFGVVCIVIFAIMLVSLFTRKQPFKMALTKTIILLTCTLGFYMSIFLPLTLTELWFPQRSVVGFWGIPMLLSLPVKTTVLYNKKMNFFLKIPNVIIVCMLVINIVTCHRFGRDLHRVNGMDILRTQEIETYINQYEKENNIVVQKLAFHYDADPLYVYPGIVNYHENNQAAWSAEWNPIALMCIVGEKEFEEIPFEEPLYLLHFEGKNWDVFSPEQILFDGDTAYILIY